MIPQAYIIEWSEHVPWKSYAQVEQDLIISRALVSIFSDDFLASQLSFRGGTALHKLHLSPQARYSEDIDLVQLEPGPIKPIVSAIRAVISPWLGDNTSTKSTKRSFKRFYKFESEIEPVQPMKLKIEINTTEHFSVNELTRVPFHIRSDWFGGHCSIQTYQLEELLGTKMRALYQRSKGRDLFDLDYALNTRKDLDKTEIIRCFCKYILYSNRYIPTSTELKLNLDEKMNNTDFTKDTTGLLRAAVEWDKKHAYENVARLIKEVDHVRDKYKSQMTGRT